MNDYSGETGNPCESGDAIDSGDFGDSGGYGDSGDSSGYCILDILELKNIACVGSFKHFVFVLVCVFVIVNMCQEAVNIINFPQLYDRLGF